jgi:putative effector of murein hydrolase LrgA (UPF0299 family)
MEGEMIGSIFAMVLLWLCIFSGMIAGHAVSHHNGAGLLVWFVAANAFGVGALIVGGW